MKVVILYQPESEHDTRVQEYVEDFRRVTGRELTLLDAYSKEGVELAKTHDILQFPAIVVVENDGGFVESYTELDKWPTASELSYYAK